MNSLDNLGDTSLDAGLVSKISNVLASLANDDSGLLGGDEGTEGQGGVGIGSLAILDEVVIIVVVTLGGVFVSVLGERHLMVTGRERERT